MAEREGIAIAIARQWKPKLKSRAQVSRKKTILGVSKRRGKITLRKIDPLDFATSPERLALAELTADFSKVFGPVFQIPDMPMRRRYNGPIKLPDLDLDSI